MTVVPTQRGISSTLELKSKGKDIPVTGHGGPWGCERLRLPYYLDIITTDLLTSVKETRRVFGKAKIILFK
jgi:hypothetical protein